MLKKMLQNEHLFAKIGVATAENEPPKVHESPFNIHMIYLRAKMSWRCGLDFDAFVSSFGVVFDYLNDNYDVITEIAGCC